MEELPKIVQQWLATAPTEDHPDANLLTAFSEKSLTARERGEVLRHLAVCATCREITSLALPQEEEAFARATAVGSGRASLSPAPVSSPRTFNLRWGVLVACAIVVIGLAWFRYRTSETFVAGLPKDVVSSPKPPEPRAAPVADKVSPSRAKVKSAAPGESRELRAGKTSLVKSQEEIQLPAKDSLSANLAMADGISSPVPPPPAAPGNEKLQGKATIDLSPVPQAEVNNRPPGNAGLAPALARQAGLDEKGKKVVAGGSTLNAVGGMETSIAATRLEAFVRWTLSDGNLRRSTDAGLSWEVVSVDQAAKFRALSVLGPELWVGGKNGVLYHSLDNGVHWVHVIPSAGDESLTEDVERLEFADANHGKLITPHAEWTTKNRGTTWRRRSKQ